MHFSSDLNMKLQAGQTKLARIGTHQGKLTDLKIKADGKVDQALIDSFQAQGNDNLILDIHDLRDFHRSNGATGLPKAFGEAVVAEGSEEVTGHKNIWSNNLMNTPDGFLGQTVSVHGEDVSLTTTFLSLADDEKGSKTWLRIKAKLDQQGEVKPESVTENLEWIAVDYSK